MSDPKYPPRPPLRLISVKLAVACIFAAGTLAAQMPRTGDLEFYGLRRISEEKLRKILNVVKGSPLPPSKGDLEDRLEEVSGIVRARVEAVCCEGNQAVLFVGIEEKGAPHFAFRSLPTGAVELPAPIVDNYRQFLQAVSAAARRGSTAEDLTHGHPLMADPDARAFQSGFLDFAGHNLALLRDVLRNSANDEDRAIAAALIGYAPKKQDVINDLEYAMQDPDEAVRANATEALTAIGVLARQRPDLGLKLSPTWFVEMLNSVVLGDRTKATWALVNLTDRKGGPALDQIRTRALAAVVEMARWKTLRYALPAFVLVGRMAGLSEQQIQDVWTRGDRETVIAKVLEKR